MKKLDHIFRIAIVAEEGSTTGRIIKSLISDEEELDSTFIVSFHQQHQVIGKKRLKLEIWFIPGDEKYFHLVDIFCFSRRVDCLLFCVDEHQLVESMQKYEKLKCIINGDFSPSSSTENIRYLLSAEEETSEEFSHFAHALGANLIERTHNEEKMRQMFTKLSEELLALKVEVSIKEACEEEESTCSIVTEPETVKSPLLQRLKSWKLLR